MTKEKTLAEEQREAVYKAVGESMANADFSDIFTEFEEFLAKQEPLTGELGEMWEEYSTAYSKIDDLESFIERLEQKFKQADLPQIERDKYLKILESEKRVIAASKQEENTLSSEDPDIYI